MVAFDFSPIWCARRAVSSHSIAVNLVIADNVPHAVGKNLSAAAGQRIDARFFHLHERFADGQLRPLRQIGDFHHGKGLHVDLRKALFQSGNQVEKILKRQIRMQSADNVELGNRFGVAGSGRLESFFQRHGVGAGSIFLASKSAQAASGHANIRRIDMAVDVEVRLVAMHPLANPVGQPADGQDVARAI